MRLTVATVLLVVGAPTQLAMARPSQPTTSVNCLALVWQNQQASDKRFDVLNDRSGQDAISCGTLTSASAYARTLRKIRASATRGNRRELVTLVNFPLTFIDERGVRTRLDRVQLNMSADRVFNQEVLNLLRHIDLGEMEVVNNKGGYFSSGAVWLDAPAVGGDPRIRTINHHVLIAWSARQRAANADPVSAVHRPPRYGAGPQP